MMQCIIPHNPAKICYNYSNMIKVLIVDDHAILREGLIRIVGFDPEIEVAGSVKNASEAINFLSGMPVDIVILDINMPEVSGLDLLEFLRRRAEWKNLPVIMLSTEAADVTVDKAMKLGANGYVMKPVTIEELERAVNNALQKH